MPKFPRRKKQTPHVLGEAFTIRPPNEYQHHQLLKGNRIIRLNICIKYNV